VCILMFRMANKRNRRKNPKSVARRDIGLGSSCSTLNSSSSISSSPTPTRAAAVNTGKATVLLKKARKSYDGQRMQSALSDVQDGMSVKKAAQKWSVPRTTLNDLKLGRYKHDARPGPCTILTKEEELLLVEWIIEMSRRGLPLNRDNLLDSIQEIISEDNRSNPFSENRPGFTWYKLFLKRHPAISERHAEAISRGRGLLTEGCVRGWFQDANEYFRSKNIECVK